MKHRRVENISTNQNMPEMKTKKMQLMFMQAQIQATRRAMVLDHS